MSNFFWRPSDDQRRTILLLEALGLIHDLGKLSDTFLKSQEPSSRIEYNHNLLADPRKISTYQSVTAGSPVHSVMQEWLNTANDKRIRCAFEERADLTDVLVRVQFIDWRGEVYTFAELAPLVASPGLVKVPPEDWQQSLGKRMEPGLLIGALHGIAHIEKEGEPDKHKQPYSDVFRASPFGQEEHIETGRIQELTDALRDLPLDEIEQITSTQRRKWLDEMKTGLSRGLADNRRPHNEVSLWDWGFTVATLAKAAAAYVYKNGWPANLDDLPFRTLYIVLNRLERYTRVDRISDLLGLRHVLDASFDRVQSLLEETHALGNCFYRDETGAYFLLADLGYSEEEMASLRQEIQSCFPSDLQPQVYWGEVITAGELDKDKRLARKLVAEPRHRALQEPPVSSGNNLYLFQREWNEERPENAEVCTVCGVRPVGYPRQGTSPSLEHQIASWATQEKAERRHVCRVCLDRRGRRAQEWAEKGLEGTTWMDEVADDNGRVALLVGRLGLEGWLDGALLATIQVTRNVTKIPSPARLYRIAETARAFWKKVNHNLAREVIGQRPFRLALYPSDRPGSLGDFHAYELDVNGVTLSVVWDPPNSRFLAVENLNYFFQRWRQDMDELFQKLQGGMFDVLEPPEYGKPRRVVRKVKIERWEKLEGYYPIIPLLAEPTLGMLIVPADQALELARAIKREYETMMGRVRDRLPLFLGLVFAQRRTPVRALLEAGRSMLDMASSFDMKNGTGWEGWRLSDKGSPRPNEIELTFDHDITWRVPKFVGDGKTKDEWYPRMYEGDTWHKKTPKHVKDLRVRNPNIPPDKGWMVWVRPSRFDFEFLDTTGRRFDIYYDKNGRRPRRTRPYYLEDLDRLEELWKYMQRLLRAQRYQVIRTIEATREMWYGHDPEGHSLSDKVFKQFVEDTLAGANWPKEQPWCSIEKKWKKKLIQAGVRGELTDWAELHMEILKE